VQALIATLFAWALMALDATLVFFFKTINSPVVVGFCRVISECGMVWFRRETGGSTKIEIFTHLKWSGRLDLLRLWLAPSGTFAGSSLARELA